MTKAAINLDTAIGPFSFVAECDHPPSEVSMKLTTFEPRVDLPPGMSILRCRAVVLHVTTQVGVDALRWSCESSSGVAGSPCTGQSLDAQEWKADGRLVVVGTEDGEALASRLRFLQLDPDSNLARYASKKLELIIPRLPASAVLSLHFILAENTWPESADSSAWFAVDVPHDQLVAQYSAGSANASDGRESTR